MPGSEPGVESVAVSKAYIVSALKELTICWSATCVILFIIIINSFFIEG